MQEFVSICIPVFNGEPFLRQCLDSCLSQDYSNTELIVCDDGSTDGSRAILDDYSAKHTKLKVYFNEKNLGLVANWNRCLELAKGEWIKMVFQDDFLTPNAISEFLRHIRPDTKLLVSQRNFLLPDSPSENVKNYYSNVVRTLENTIPNRSGRYSGKDLSRAAIQNMAMNFIAEPSLIMFRKDLLAEMGAFNPLLKQICDLEFVLRLGSRYGLDYIPQKLCVFRIHEASTTNLNVSSKHFELSFIEPVVFSGLLLYAKEFSVFRNHLNFLARQKLKLYFELKVYRAKRQNDHLHLDHPIFKTQQVFSEALQKAAKGNLLIKLLDRLI